LINNKYNGVTPAFVFWNLLHRYAKEGDLVVHPMCGRGAGILGLVWFSHFG